MFRIVAYFQAGYGAFKNYNLVQLEDGILEVNCREVFWVKILHNYHLELDYGFNYYEFNTPNL